MKTQNKILITAAAAFAGGFVAGVLSSPRSVPEARQEVLRKARLRTQWMMQQLRLLERQLAVLERQIQATGEQFGQRVHDATSRAMDQIIPVMPENGPILDTDDLTQELPRMPHD